jgi:hypothetical protein
VASRAKHERVPGRTQARIDDRFWKALARRGFFILKASLRLEGSLGMTGVPGFISGKYFVRLAV